MTPMGQETGAAEPARPLRASERFAALIGIPVPPWTEQDEARFQDKMAAADADLFARIDRRASGQSAA